MMRLSSLILFLFFLPCGARRTTRVVDHHHGSHQQNNTLANSLGAQEAFLPGGVRRGVIGLGGLLPFAPRTEANMQAGTGPGIMPGDNSADPGAGNYGRLSDKLKEADLERRLEQEEIEKRENAAKLKREQRERKIALLRDIPDNVQAGTVGDFMYKEGVQDILNKLDYDLIGLQAVKERVREIASLLVVDKMRLKLGLETSVPSLHMSFTGSPGTGKTTVALRMGQILQRMGYCRTGHVVVATRDDLVGQYVGHTAPKTKEMVKKAMGGILLVDEAYYLYNAANDRDYGQESIEILLNVMENNKEDLIVILAGYKDRMDKFYGFIPGMNSRIGNHIDFPNYLAEELCEIGKVMCRELEYKLGPGAAEALEVYLDKRSRMPFFANARTVRNTIDLARMASAVRIFTEKSAPGSDGMVTEEELQTILPEDFPEIDEEALQAAAEEAATSEHAKATRDPAPTTVDPHDPTSEHAGKGFGGGEATRDPAPTAVDPSDPKGKQQAIHKAESFADYMAKRQAKGGA